MPPATLVAGRYELVEMLGRGGMGAVWRAHDRLLGREVALKEVAPPAGVDPEPLYRRVIREARSAARLDHPGIVTVHDVVEQDGRPWIVMQLVRAPSLDEVIHTRGVLPPAQVAAIGSQLLAALRVAHAAGVVHRDVKPANVLLAADRAVLTDFGIASLAGDPALTSAGSLLGSPSYLSPEQARRLPASPQSDLWALGATLYAAVEGRSPYARGDLLSVLTALLQEEPDPPRNAGPLTPLLQGLLRKDPAQRIGADEAAHLLAAAQAPVSPNSSTAPGFGGSSTVALPPRSLKPLLFAGGGVVVVAALTLAAVFALQDQTPEKELANTSPPGTTAPAALPERSAEPEIRAGEKLYKGPLFTAVIPSVWEAEEKDGTTLKDPKAVAQGITVGTFTGLTSDLKAEVESVAKDMGLPGYKRIGGVTDFFYLESIAYEIEFTFTQGEHKAHAKMRVCRFRGAYLQMVLITAEDRWQQTRPIYQRFLETFRET